MAIYSLHLRSVGRTTHAAGTAGAHVDYITRSSAASRIMGEHMPTDPSAAHSWLDAEEQADRKNARVVDKLRIALPRELTPDQRAQVLQEFCQDLTGGRCAWMAAIHDQGKDAHNPHAHVIVRDRDIETAKRVMKLSDSEQDRRKAGLEPSACEWVRQRWEHHANRALEREGCAERIDRRTLEVQKIDREPQIHVGPAVKAMAEKGLRPESQERERAKSPRFPKADPQPIRYPEIDQGKTRAEHNAQIIDLNAERERRRQEQLTPEDRAREQAKAEEARREAEARSKERRELELFKKSLEEAAERRLEDLAQKQVRELRPFQADSQAKAMPPVQPESQSRLGALFSRAADKLNPSRVREREEQQRAEEERRQREAEESRRRSLEALLQRQERERLDLERQIAETQQQKLEAFREQQAKIREQRARGAVIERQRTQERGTDFGRERERGPQR